jgi:hypothetical protein
MTNPTRLGTLLFLVGLTAACTESAAGPVAPAAAELAQAAAPGAALYTLQFSGDIESAPLPNVLLNPAVTLANAAYAGTVITLPAVADLAGCGAAGGNWAPYEGTWKGQLAISQSRGVTTLQIVGRDARGVPFWLAIKDDAVLTRSAGVSTLTFVNATTMVKQDKFPLIIRQPCASFTLTATAQ